MVYEGGQPRDFRRLIHGLELNGVAIHPVEPHRYLMPSGAAIMADGIVAEVASAPVELAPGFTDELDRWGASGYSILRAALSNAYLLKGGSTHLSVQCDSETAHQLAWLYTQTFAPALMLLLDDRRSPGLLARPRPDRLELCGEFASGDRLQAAAAFAAGSVLALERAVTAGGQLPRRLCVRVEPGRRRLGWYVDRRAFGPDLYASGRNAVLRTRAGATISAQHHLEECWTLAREALGNSAATGDLTATDAIVSGEAPLPCEMDAVRTEPEPRSNPGSHPYGAMLSTRECAGYVVRPATATWDFAAFAISDGRRQVYANVPRPLLPAFLESIDGGTLNDLLKAYLGCTSSSSRVLASHRDALVAGLWDRLAAGPTLVPSELPGLGGTLVASLQAAKICPPPQTGVTAGQSLAAPEPANSGARRWPWLALVALVAVVVVVAFLLLRAGGGDDDSAQADPTQTEPGSPPTATGAPATSDPGGNASITPTVDDEPTAASADTDDQGLSTLMALPEGAFDQGITIEDFDAELVNGAVRFTIAYSTPIVRDSSIENVTLQASIQTLDGRQVVASIRFNNGEAALAGVEISPDREVTSLSAEVQGTISEDGRTAVITAPLSEEFLSAAGDYFANASILLGSEFLTMSDLLGIPNP
jgi:hypothetical protein